MAHFNLQVVIDEELTLRIQGLERENQALKARAEHLLADNEALRISGERDAQAAAFFYNQAKHLLEALETLYGDAVLDGPAQLISAAVLNKARGAIRATGVVHVPPQS